MRAGSCFGLVTVLLLGLSGCSEPAPARPPSSTAQPVAPSPEIETLRARIKANLEKVQKLCTEHGITGKAVADAFYATDWSQGGEQRLARMPEPIRETVLDLHRDLERHHALLSKAQDEAEGLELAEVKR